MKSPRSHLPQTSTHKIYSLDEFIHPSTSDQGTIDCLTSLFQPGKEELERHRLDNPGVSPDQLPSFLLIKRRLAAAEAEAEAERHRLDNPGASPDRLPSVFLFKRRLEAELNAMAKSLCGYEGEWSKENMVAIRNAAFQANSPDSTRCVGTKTTLEFIPTGAKKAVLGMTKYNLLRPSESDGLYLDEEVSLCHIFPLEPKKPNAKRQRSGCAAGQCNNAELPPTHEWKEELSNVDMTNSAPVGVDDYSVDVPVRPWDNYTKIYTEDPELIYAACNHCNAMLKLTGGAGCGTKSLINHSKSLKCKKKQQQQQPGNTSVKHVPLIALDGHHGISTDGVEIRGISVEIGEP